MAARAMSGWHGNKKTENLQPLVLLGPLVYLPQGPMRIALVILLKKWHCAILLCVH